MAYFGELRGTARLDNVGREAPGSLARRRARWGYAFISLWIVGFTLFYLVPMIASLVFSLYDFQLATPEDSRFIGLANWRRMLFDDPLVWRSLGVTFKFALITLPIGLVFSLFLALLLNSEHLLGKSTFRTLFYAPTMVPAIAAVLIWTGVLNPTTGWINGLIEWTTGYQAVGPNGIRWLDDPILVYIAYTFIGLWGIGNAIIFYLASLQGVPTELYEAAWIDGAGWFRRLWHISFPMITPVIFYNLILSVIGLLQFFNVPYVLNGGNGYPQGATHFYMIHFFKQAFSFQNMGYGATLAWFMFLIALAITLVLFGTARHWVYYAGEKS
jgi:multiple sugar transport system permease protein